jgi:hypothetical protein
MLCGWFSVRDHVLLLGFPLASECLRARAHGVESLVRQSPIDRDVRRYDEVIEERHFITQSVKPKAGVQIQTGKKT